MRYVMTLFVLVLAASTFTYFYTVQRFSIGSDITSHRHGTLVDTLFQWKNQRRDILASGHRPKKVLLFTYMRGGSTFLGSLFQTHPEAIYWYESLGPFYKGFLLEDWPALSPVWFNQDYSVRNLGINETSAIATFMNNLLGCDLIRLYPEELSHTFMSASPTTKAVKKCVRNNCSKRERPTECTSKSFIERIQMGCDSKVAAAGECFHRNLSCVSTQKPYLDRLHCFPFDETVKTCIQNFEAKCRRYRLRTTKVNRISMQAVEDIILKIPEIHIVYYVRDPRAIWMSRKRQRVKPDNPIEALCAQMLNDYKIYLELRKKFPDAIYFMKYEDLAEDAYGESEKLFKFLGEVLGQTTKKHLESVTLSQRKNVDRNPQGFFRTDSNKTATAWRQKISYSTSTAAQKYCMDIIIRLGYDL